MGTNYKLVTLTTPEWFDSGVIHRAWRMLVMRIRRRSLPREYFAVKEFNEKGTCCHLHVVFRCTYADVVSIRSQWTIVIGTLTGCKIVKKRLEDRDVAYLIKDGVELQIWCHVNIRKYYSRYKLAAYLAKYLVKSLRGKRGYWYSYGWIYRG